jgi:hypothetical protein
MNLVNSCKTDIQMWFCSETHHKLPDRLFIPNYHFHRTDRFPRRKDIPHNHMVYVRYVHLTKAKPIHKKQTHPLVRDVT